MIVYGLEIKIPSLIFKRIFFFFYKILWKWVEKIWDRFTCFFVLLKKSLIGNKNIFKAFLVLT